MLIFAPEAEEDVDRLFSWLIARNPAAAARFLATLKLAAARIAEKPMHYPLAGEDEALRKHLMRFGGSAYVIYFLTDGDDQVIVRIWHGRERRA